MEKAELINQFRNKIQQLERDIGWQLKTETECCGVSLAQSQTLFLIANRGEASVIELAEDLSLDTSTLSRTINNLVNQGLVNRVLNPDDRRYVRLTLTEKGRSVCATIEEFTGNFIEKILRYIPDEKHLQVMESFSLLADAIKKIQCCSGIQNEMKQE